MASTNLKDVSALADLVVNTPSAAIPPEAVHGFRRAFIDYLACALSGADLPVTKMVRAWAEEEGSAPVASVIGTGQKLAAPLAALVNGASAHGMDFDDGQTRGSVHPGGAIFSAALAAAEKSGASMRALIEGAILGYDVMLRIASTMHPASAKKGWHNTPVSGVFGATATAARIWGLNAEQTRNALGIAASFSGGLRQYLHDGAEVKRLHPGKAARDGLVCAGLAAKGITGTIEALTGEHGLFNAMIENRVDIDQLTQGMREVWLINSAYFKPYPCCRHYHAAIDAALELRREHDLTSDQVTQIDIGLYSVGAVGHDHITARNLLEAQMSAPCAVATVLMSGRAGRADFEPEVFETAEAQRLLSVTRTYVDEACESLYPKVRSGYVRLTLTDGRIIERRILDPRGEGDNPLTDEDLSQKFLGNAIDVLGEAQAREVLSILWAASDSTDLAALMTKLTKGQGA